VRAVPSGEQAPRNHHGASDQAQEQGGHRHGVGGERRLEEVGQRERRQQDPAEQRQEEGPLDAPQPHPESGDVAAQEQARGAASGSDRRHEPGVDVEDQGDRPARHARHDVGRAHEEAAGDVP